MLHVTKIKSDLQLDSEQLKKYTTFLMWLAQDTEKKTNQVNGHKPIQLSATEMEHMENELVKNLSYYLNKLKIDCFENWTENREITSIQVIHSFEKKLKKAFRSLTGSRKYTKENLLAALENNDGNRKLTAEELHISERTLYRHLNKLAEESRPVLKHA